MKDDGMPTYTEIEAAQRRHRERAEKIEAALTELVAFIDRANAAELYNADEYAPYKNAVVALQPVT